MATVYSHDTQIHIPDNNTEQTTAKWPFNF